MSHSRKKTPGFYVVKGSANSTNYPFLTGWIDSLKEAMAHTNKSKL